MECYDNRRPWSERLPAEVDPAERVEDAERKLFGDDIL
jgi:hypothetical protein